jgi:hypothetical protein
VSREFVASLFKNKIAASEGLWKLLREAQATLAR